MQRLYTSAASCKHGAFVMCHTCLCSGSCSCRDTLGHMIHFAFMHAVAALCKYHIHMGDAAHSYTCLCNFCVQRIALYPQSEEAYVRFEVSACLPIFSTVKHDMLQYISQLIVYTAHNNTWYQSEWTSHIYLRPLHFLMCMCNACRGFFAQHF